MTDWVERARGANAETAEHDRWRVIRALDGEPGIEKTLPDGRPVVSFASNDYLGLTGHPRVIAAARDALERYGAGSGSARLIVGARPIHDELERALARWKATARALLFPTGFAANLGVLSAFGTQRATIFSDELNHASIVDGCRLARAESRVYPHNDLRELERMLSGANEPIVVSDSVFSMDGDVADVAGLVELTARHGALLVLDEAHAVLGPPVPAADHVIRVGTLSKFIGSAGGFVAAAEPFIDYLINNCRPFIFTTAGSPADAGAALAAVELVGSDEGAALRTRLADNIERFRPGHPSPIVPVVIGDDRVAVDAAARLLEDGFLVPAIRPPSVAPGTARLRVTLSALHTFEQIDALKEALDRVAMAGVAR
ncbi:MAG: 8-amino-7-oxononanoate synthase [Actinomycetota bacterium]|jgi:8-amino-7-oxononanoate synthase|nr:8-amino-7-oxononanoate synthase [Actinomycetota bacterium]